MLSKWILLRPCMIKSIFILYSYLIFPSSLSSLFYVQHCYSNTSFLESLGQFSLSLIFFFFNCVLLFVSLGSIITHFIHLLLPVSQGTPVFPPQTLLFLKSCLSDNLALEVESGERRQTSGSPAQGSACFL